MSAFQVSQTTFSDLAALFATAEANAKELEEARSRISDLQRWNDEQGRTITEMDSRIGDLNTKLAEVVRERDTFRQQYHDADAACTSLRGDYDASQSLLSESQAEVARLRDTLTSRDQRIQEMEENAKVDHDHITLLSSRLGQVRYHLREAMGLAEDNWTDPRTPLPTPEPQAAPEVAPVPLSVPASEDPPAQPLAASDAGMEHGTQDPPGYEAVDHSPF